MSDPTSNNLAALSEQISGAVTGAVTESKMAVGELTLTVDAARILDVLTWLQGPGEFKILVDICGNDWPQRAKRFDVVYHLLSLTNNQRVRVKIQVAEDETVPSTVSVY